MKKPPIKPIGTFDVTARGFGKVTFTDVYANKCSLQISSKCVCEDDDGKVADPLGYLWLGIEDPDPKIMKRDAWRLGHPIVDDGLGEGERLNGWTPYKIPEEVSINTRMHLNEHQVRDLIARLEIWLKTSELHTKKEIK